MDEAQQRKLDDALLHAADWRDLDEMNELLDAGANVDARNMGGSTALMILARHEHNPGMLCLLRRGADPVDLLGRACARWRSADLLSTILQTTPLDLKSVMADYQTKHEGRTLLFAAIECGNYDAVRRLVKDGLCPVDTTDNKGHTPLMHAIRSDQLNIVKYLMNEDEGNVGYLPRAIDSETGKTPLHHACRCGRFSIVEFLVEQQPRWRETVLQDAISLKDNQGQTPIMNAAKHGYLKIVAFFAQRLGADKWAQAIEDMTNDKGENIVHLACGGYNVDELEAMLAVIPDKKAQLLRQPTTMNKWTPLHYACYFGVARMAAHLLTEGAWVGVAGIVDTAEDIVAAGEEQQQGDIEEHRMDEEGERDIEEQVAPFLLSAQQNHYSKILSVFLEFAAGHPNITLDLNAANEHGQTLLHFACQTGNLSNVKKLFEPERNIADQPTIRDLPNTEAVDSVLEQTPLNAACRKGHFEIFWYLFQEQGARVERADLLGCTPLHYACLYGDLEVVKAILASSQQSQSSLLAAVDMDGWTPLMVACLYKRRNVVRHLLDGLFY